MFIHENKFTFLRMLFYPLNVHSKWFANHYYLIWVLGGLATLSYKLVND